MTLAYADRVFETTTTTSTGTYTLAGAKTGFQAFSIVGNGSTCVYCCTDGTNWEVGLGTYTLSGTTLARTTIYASSNSNSAVSWSAGSKDIFLTSAASKTAFLNAPQSFSAAQRGAFYTLTDGSTIAIDLSLANQFRVLLAGNRTLGVPTN